MRFVSHPGVISLVMYSGATLTTNEPKIIKSENLKNMAVEKTLLLVEATNEGIKACVNAPSAKMFLKRFGSLFARKKMSLQYPAPKTEAITTSRTNPKTRDKSMPKLLVKIDFNRIILFGIKLRVFYLNITMN